MRVVKALPLVLAGIVIPLVILAGSVKSQDARANWATWLPLWATDPTTGMNVAFGIAMLAALYWIVAYGFVPSLQTQPASPPSGRADPAMKHILRTGQRNPLYGLVVAGLTKALADLNGIKREDLSSGTLAAWQARVRTATAMAHANGLGLHNPISQQLNAAQALTDTDELDLVRHHLAQMIEATIAEAMVRAT